MPELSRRPAQTDMIAVKAMKPRTMILMLALAVAAWPQQERPELPDERKSMRLPSGKTQAEEILKADHERSLEDAARLMKLSEDLRIELEKNDRHVLSLGAIKKTEEIEKIAKRIRARMRRF